MSETITALVVEPGKRPYTKKIQPGLKSLQREVGGHIEAVYPFPEPVTIVCRESGKLDGCPLNRALRDEAGAIYDVIAGTFLVVGLTEEDFGSLSSELLQAFTQRFRQPETFMIIDGQLLAVPLGAHHDSGRSLEWQVLSGGNGGSYDP